MCVCACVCVRVYMCAQCVYGCVSMYSTKIYACVCVCGHVHVMYTQTSTQHKYIHTKESGYSAGIYWATKNSFPELLLFGLSHSGLMLIGADKLIEVQRRGSSSKCILK